MLTLLAALALAEVQPAPDFIVRIEPCENATSIIAQPCTLPLPIDPVQAVERLGNRDRIWWIAGDRLSMIARATVEPWTMLCCAIQTPLEPISGTELGGVTVRIPQIDKAILDIGTFPSDGIDFVNWRGANAPAAPPVSAPLLGTITEVTLHPKYLGVPRRLTIYLPPDIPTGVTLPAFYLADGSSRHFAAIAEAAIKAGRAAPVVLVGIESGPSMTADCQEPSCDRRQLEYVVDASEGENSPTSPFGMHMSFVVNDVIPYVEGHYPVSPKRMDRAVGGYSNGGAWAFVAAEMHPQIFGSVMGLSSGSRIAANNGSQLIRTRVFGGSGLFEENFRARTDLTIANAAKAGAQTRSQTLVTGHSPLAWDIFFENALHWFFPPHPSAIEVP